VPAAIPFLVAAAVPAAYAAFAYIATSVLVGVYQADRARKKLHRFLDSIQSQPRSLTIRSPIAARRLVLGTTRVPGILHYAEFVGSNEEYFDTVQVFAHHELDAVLGVYVGQEFIAAADIVSTDVTTGTYSVRSKISFVENLTVPPSSTTITLAHTPYAGATDVSVSYPDGVSPDTYSVQLGIASVVGNVITLTAPYTAAPGVTVNYSYYSDRPLRLQWVMGTASQAAMSWAGISTPKWGANHRCLGMAALRALHVAEHTVYATGYPDITLLARGPKGVFDPRIPGNVNGTSNPALLAAWYRTLPRADGGMGIPTTWIDWPSVAAAANICDELISVKTLDGSSTELIKRYECNTVLYLADGPTRADNLRQILSAMAGEFPFSGGLYRCYAGAYRAPTFTITDADICAGEPIQFTPSAGGFKKPPNVMTAQIFDKAKDYIEVGAPEVSNTTYITNDGGEETDEISLPATTDSRQANYLMGLRLEQKRPAIAGNLTLGGIGADMLLLDALQFSLPDYPELAGKAFEVRQWGNGFNGRYPVQLLETRSSSFVLDPNKFTPVTQPAPPNLGYLFHVQPVDNVLAFSGTDERQVLPDGTVIARIRVTWLPHVQDYVLQTGQIEVRWKRAAATAWINEAPLAGDAVTTYLYPVVDNEIYLIEVRAVNGRGNWSDWTPKLHTALPVAGNEGQAGMVLVAHGNPGMLIRGNTVKKNAGASAWDAGAYSKSPIGGACELHFVSDQADKEKAMGLNTDPTTNASWDSVDHLILLRSNGDVDIFESGALVADNVTTHVAGDRFSVSYDELAVRYWKNGTFLRQIGVAPEIIFYADSSFLHVGGSFSSIQFVPRSRVRRGNLIDPGVWRTGTTGDQGTRFGAFFDSYGGAAENSVVFDTAPDGTQRPIWRGESSDAAASDTDGGFITGNVPIDTSQPYRLSCFIRASGALDGNYGIRVSGTNAVADIPTGTPQAFLNLIGRNRSELVAARYYWISGHVLPSGIGTSPPSPSLSGVYDVATGQRVAGGVDAKWVSTTAEAAFFVFQFGASVGAIQDFWAPRFEICDGTEPSIDQLLAVAKPSLVNTVQIDFEGQYGINGRFARWLAGASLPEGWNNNAGGTITRETAITRGSPNAVRVVSTGSTNDGLYHTVNVSSQPFAFGSFVEGYLDAYLVSHTSGGYPGMLVRLYTNAALSTQRDIVFNLPNTTTGAWQTIHFKAAVNDGERIYGVRFYALGGYTLLSGGNGVNTVIFGGLVARAVQPSGTGHVVANSMTDTVVATGSGSTDHEFAVEATATLCTFSYANVSGRTVTVQVEAVCHDLYVYGTLTTNFDIAEVEIVTSGAVSGNGTFEVHDLFAVSPPSAGNYQGTARVYQWSVAVGGTLVVTLRLHARTLATHPSYAINGSGVLRAAAIKA
jgi:hypothetical protein